MEIAEFVHIIMMSGPGSIRCLHQAYTAAGTACHLDPDCRVKQSMNQ